MHLMLHKDNRSSSDVFLGSLHTTFHQVSKCSALLPLETAPRGLRWFYFLLHFLFLEVIWKPRSLGPVLWLCIVPMTLARGDPVCCQTLSSSRVGGGPSSVTGLGVAGSGRGCMVNVFNWRVIALWCCDSFCPTATWINCMYAYIPSVLSPPPSHPIPPLQVITEHGAEFPMLCSSFSLAKYFTHSRVRMSVRVSQPIPPWPHAEQRARQERKSTHQQTGCLSCTKLTVNLNLGTHMSGMRQRKSSVTPMAP